MPIYWMGKEYTKLLHSEIEYNRAYYMGNLVFSRGILPTDYIYVFPDRLIMTDMWGEFQLISSDNWEMISGPEEYFSLDYTEGSSGTYTISVLAYDYAQGSFVFRNKETRQTASLYVVFAPSFSWILETGRWNMLGFWKDEGVWNF